MYAVLLILERTFKKANFCMFQRRYVYVTDYKS